MGPGIHCEPWAQSWYRLTMAIKVTPKVWQGTGSYVDGAPVMEHAGRVVAVERFYEHRNFSDTLDYSDWRWHWATKALVYVGRTAPEAGPLGHWVNGRWLAAGEPLGPTDRFATAG